MSEPLTSLVKKIDRRVNEAAGVRQSGPELGTYVIFVNNAEGMDCELHDMAEREWLKRVSLGIGVVPADYNIAPEADVTVVIYEVGRRGNPVSANFALRLKDCDEKQVDAIIAALSKVLPK